MKTTKKDYELFKKYFLEYKEKLGITGWKVYFQHVSYNKDTYATIVVNLEAHVATVYFSDEVTKIAYDNLEIERTAKHECIHLLLARMSELGHKRFCAEDEIMEAEEELVLRIEELV